MKSPPPPTLPASPPLPPPPPPVVLLFLHSLPTLPRGCSPYIIGAFITETEQTELRISLV